jgi:chemotaxis-related protein WspD
LPQVVHCRNCEVYQQAGRAVFERVPPEGDARDWTATLAAPPSAMTGPHEQVLVFRLGGEWLGLPVAVIVEVLEWRPVRRLPHPRDEMLLGIVNVHGDLQLCVSLDAVLGQGPPQLPAGAQVRLLALGEGTVEWTTPVSETRGIADVPLDALAAAPATVPRSDRPFVRGVFEYRQEPVGLLDGRLVLERLRERLA